MISCFCPAGGWRMNCWRSNRRVTFGPRIWAPDSAPAASRLWAWSSTAAISARCASLASATAAVLWIPDHGSGNAPFVTSSRKCDSQEEPEGSVFGYLFIFWLYSLIFLLLIFIVGWSGAVSSVCIDKSFHRCHDKSLLLTVVRLGNEESQQPWAVTSFGSCLMAFWICVQLI